MNENTPGKAGLHLLTDGVDNPTYQWGLSFDSQNYYAGKILAEESGTGDGNLVFMLGRNAGLYERLRINSDGRVGIGTSAPCASAGAPVNCLFSVGGAIQAKEVVVNTGWSDYVFDPAYRLMPLQEVAEFVHEHGHLPNIPSAAQVQEQGVSIGDMQSRLLAKIEELTLHMIAAEHETAGLRAQNRSLADRVADLEGRREAR